MDLCCTLELGAGGCFWCQFGADFLAVQSSGAQDTAQVLNTQILIPSRPISNSAQNPWGILCFWR